MNGIATRILGFVAVAAVALFVGGIAGGLLVRTYDSRQTAVRAEADARTRAAAVESAAAESDRRVNDQAEIARQANDSRTAALSDAFAARADAASLHKQLAAYTAAHRIGNPAAPANGTATGDPLDLLANLFERADERAGQLAQYADAARIAGIECQRDYDALTASPAVPASGVTTQPGE